MASLTAHGLGATGIGGNKMGKETPYIAGCFPEILCEGGKEGGEGGREGREGGRRGSSLCFRAIIQLF